MVIPRSATLLVSTATNQCVHLAQRPNQMLNARSYVFAVNQLSSPAPSNSTHIILYLCTLFIRLHRHSAM